jgi:phosphoglycolate phosphatase-like HAD superfamily hydrolase
VTNGLAQLVASQRRVVILTEGKRDSACRMSSNHGLADYFEDICTGNKDASLFQQMRRSFGAPHLLS